MQVANKARKLFLACGLAALLCSVPASSPAGVVYRRRVPLPTPWLYVLSGLRRVSLVPWPDLLESMMRTSHWRVPSTILGFLIRY